MAVPVFFCELGRVVVVWAAAEVCAAPVEEREVVQGTEERAPTHNIQAPESIVEFMARGLNVQDRA